MTVAEIQAAAARPAVPLIPGGFRPTHRFPEESWIGRVTAFAAGEGVPTDVNGKQMMPLAQVFLPSMACVPLALTGLQLLTFWLSPDYRELLRIHDGIKPFPNTGAYYQVREYADLGGLEYHDVPTTDNYLRAFPLRIGEVRSDYPIWDGGGLSRELEDAVLELEDRGEIESYYDIIDHEYGHKVGGYPSFCQSGILDSNTGFGEGFEFVLQISSDEKIGLNVIDNGSLMFARHAATRQWRLYFDFY